MCLQPHGYDHRRGGHPSVLAALEVGGGEPDVRVGSFQLSVPKSLNLPIELLAELRDIRLLEMPVIPKAFTSSLTLRVEIPWT
jgi:hypothetical protein